MNETSEVTKLSQEAVRQYVLDNNIQYDHATTLVKFLLHFDLIQWQN